MVPGSKLEAAEWRLPARIPGIMIITDEIQDKM